MKNNIQITFFKKEINQPVSSLTTTYNKSSMKQEMNIIKDLVYRITHHKNIYIEYIGRGKFNIFNNKDLIGEAITGKGD